MFFFFSSSLDWEKKEDVNFCHILFLSSFKFLLVLWINFSCFISSSWFQLVFRCDYMKVSSLLFNDTLVTCLSHILINIFFFLLQVESSWPMKTKNQTMYSCRAVSLLPGQVLFCYSSNEPIRCLFACVTMTTSCINLPFWKEDFM